MTQLVATDLYSAYYRLVSIIALKLGRKIIPSPLLNKDLWEIIQRGDNVFKHPYLLISLAFKTVYDVSPVGSIKRTYIMTKLIC